ncbi:dynein heavy chain 3, axonemal-like [Dendronephthya gigantea]|uniref:dynein heavy chain 3, axonemal-like n=1 Tax=Dendronephthya gigantea TaxID=151771 RepID=UPI00106B2B52|nr:dynein heavy chain 3, axonemal-like [Dendronephthya gigantea]
MDSLALCNPAIMRRILANKIPEKLQSDPELDALLNDLFKEVEDDYIFSIRKAIVDYILMNPSEKVRLSISAIPRPFPRRTIRAPVPWHNSYQRGKDMVIKNVFTTNPVMMEIQNVWTNRFSQVRFVDGDELLASGLPVVPEEFQERVRKQCLRTREFLKKT